MGLDQRGKKKLLPRLTFIVGGAASGKSRFAELLSEKHGVTKVYLATAQIFDEEMKKKVTQHKSRRADGWTTHETPLDAADVLRTTHADVILFDCATLWLSNHMLAEADIDTAQADLCNALAAAPSPVIMVSNEVGEGIVPENALARRFREAQGRLNIALAAQADLVVKVTVGLPQVLKGTLP